MQSCHNLEKNTLGDYERLSYFLKIRFEVYYDLG